MANNTLAYGFTQYRHLAGERVTTVGERAVFDMVQASAEEHTRMLNAILGGLVERTTLHKERYYLPSGGSLQPITSGASPVPTRATGYFDVAYPIQGGGDAFGTDRVSRALMTVGEANRMTLNMLRRDADWIYRHLMASVFNDGSWVFSDPEFGSLTIQSLADGDVEFTLVGGSTESSDHYMAQANAISDSDNPFDNIYSAFMKHPSNDGAEVIVYVPTNLVSSIQALTNFVDVGDLDIKAGMASDQINASAAKLEEVRAFGTRVLGKCDNCWIVEWNRLPDSYMFALAKGSDPVIAMREYPVAGLQGFFAENNAGDGNLQETRMIRFAGFGIKNRLAAIAYRVGNGTYATPSGYATPLPA